VNLHARPGNANLLDEEAHQLLTLFEVESVDTFSDAPGEGVNFVRQPVVDGEFVVPRQQCFALLLELSMTAEHLLMPSLEFGELNRLHLIQIDEPSSFCLGALQPTFQAVELSFQQLMIGLLRAGAEGCLAFHQDPRSQQRLAELFPYQGVQRFRASRGLRARSVGSTCLE
jgi:hypothetical protein